MIRFLGRFMLPGLHIALVGVLLITLGFLLPENPSIAQPPSTFIYLQDREPFYSPPVLSLHSGEIVEWWNRSATEHTITHDGCGQSPHCAFHSGHLHPGERFPVPRLAPGRYSYHCEIHPFMRGTIEIQTPLPGFQSTEL